MKKFQFKNRPKSSLIRSVMRATNGGNYSTRIRDILSDFMPAIPPDDYKGSVGAWMVALQVRGLWDGENPEFYGDVHIPSTTWWEILEELEGDI